MPPFLTVIRTGEAGFRKYLFQTLASLVGIVKQHIRNYLDDIFEVVIEFWGVDTVQVYGRPNAPHGKYPLT
jgi:FKBP12-rapamycin complex-associated protein